MPYLRNMLTNFARELHKDGQMHLPLAVGLGRGDMRPWEFDELAQIFEEMFPDAPPLKCEPISRHRRR